jgi:hypothetical protein
MTNGAAGGTPQDVDPNRATMAIRADPHRRRRFDGAAIVVVTSTPPALVFHRPNQIRVPLPAAQSAVEDLEFARLVVY